MLCSKKASAVGHQLKRCAKRFLDDLEEIISPTDGVSNVSIAAESWLLSHFLCPKIDGLRKLFGGKKISLVRRGRLRFKSEVQQK